MPCLNLDGFSLRARFEFQVRERTCGRDENGGNSERSAHCRPDDGRRAAGEGDPRILRAADESAAGECPPHCRVRMRQLEHESSPVRGGLDLWRICNVGISPSDRLSTTSTILPTFRELTNPRATLEAMLTGKGVTNLPGHIQAVYIHNVLKLFILILARGVENEDMQEVAEVRIRKDLTRL